MSCGSKHENNTGPDFFDNFLQGSNQDTDQFMAESDPVLFASAKEFFPGDEDTLAEKRVWRLSKPQIDNTINSLLSPYVTESVASTLPPDANANNYKTYSDRLDFNKSNAPVYFLAVTKIVDKVNANPDLLFNCVSAADKENCYSQKALEFVNSAFRGAVPQLVVNKYVQLFSSIKSQSGLNMAAASLVETVMTSPYFLFRSESQLSAKSSMSPNEVVQNLSYTLTDAPPVQFGVNVDNATDKIRDVASMQQFSQELLKTRQSTVKLINFFKDWLEVKEAEEITKDKVTFPSFTETTSKAIVEETNKFLDFHLSKNNPSLISIMNSSESFISTPLESIYNVKAAAADGTKLTKLDATQRRGVLTQASFLASHANSTKTSIVKRGNFFLKKVLCLGTSGVPQGASLKVPVVAGKTQRDQIESMTSSGSCAGCHRVINPFGFAIENFDATGAWRETDNGAAIDPKVVVDFVDNQSMTTNTAVDALKYFTETAQFKQCFVKQVFRFYMGRDETSSDHPLLRKMYFSFVKEKQDIKGLIQTMVNSPRFRQRQ